MLSWLPQPEHFENLVAPHFWKYFLPRTYLQLDLLALKCYWAYRSAVWVHCAQLVFCTLESSEIFQYFDSIPFPCWFVPPLLVGWISTFESTFWERSLLCFVYTSSETFLRSRFPKKNIRIWKFFKFELSHLFNSAAFF